MKWHEGYRKIIVEIICLMFILLFSYAATSKLLDFGQFKIQLGQSPVLTAYADYVAWSVPFIEFLLAVALATKRFRTIALYTSLGLMSSFSMYILVIQNLSDFVPCSCGGILEHMGWTEHLIFNLFFVVLGSIAIIFNGLGQKETPCIYRSLNRMDSTITTLKKRTLIQILLAISLCSAFVLGLFFFTDYKNHLSGSFIRFFPPHVISGAQKELKLPEDQYQLAGFTKNHIYLNQKGNPLRILKVDCNLNIIDTITLKLPNAIQLNIKRTHIRINDKGIFMTDGTIPMLFIGDTKSQYLKAIPLGNNYFNEAIPVDSNKLAVVKLIPNIGRRLGLLNVDSLITKLNPKALEKQVEGFFCTDGYLHYNPQMQKLIYTYYYRNEYIILDKDLKVEARYSTIDTTTTANIKIRETISKKQRSMATPPPVVNRRSETLGYGLFNQSKIRAENEPEKQFEQGEVIDVYNLKNGTYKYSFYIPNIEGHFLKDFRIVHDHLLALYPDRIVTYLLGKNYLGLLKTTPKDMVMP